MTPDEILERFFAPPNGVWPSLDPQHQAAKSILPLLSALPVRGESPVVLPRRDLKVQPFVLYVICWNAAHAGRMRPLLEAAVAHQYCHFDGRVAKLNGNDPIDSAVLELVGERSTYLLRPNHTTQSPIVRAVSRMVRSLLGMPLRNPQIPRPVGRMLREYDLALAAGETGTSASLLKEIEGVGGISHENIAFLKIRRLSQLGLESELLAHPSMPTLVAAEPPRLVREAILGAWARVDVLPALRQGVDEALKRLAKADIDYALLVDDRLAVTTDPDVATLAALVSLARSDADLMQRFSANSLVDRTLVDRLAGTAVKASSASPSAVVDGPQASVADSALPAENVGCASWLEWVACLAAEAPRSLAPGDADDWQPAWSIDAALANALDGLGDIRYEELVPGVTRFLETDDPEHPAATSASAFITRYLYAEWFSPADLGALCTLLQIFLRAAPSVPAYKALLADIQSYAVRWVSVATAVRVLDLADAVACGPAVDATTRASVIATLLSPLHEQRHRLTASERLLAGLVASDVGLEFDWSFPAPTIEEDANRRRADPAILLYSLDTGSLHRTQSATRARWPSARVQVSAATVGDSALRQHARNADIIVLATRRAAHAATNFIQANKGERTEVIFPDGSGSASMLRVLEATMAEWGR